VAALDKTISSQKADISRLTVDNATLKSNNAGLDAGLKVCNASVDNAKRIADTAAANGAALLAEVRKGNARIDNRIKSIDTMPAQTCADAEAILRAGAAQ